MSQLKPTKPTKREIKVSFMETGNKVSSNRQGMIDYCRQSKEPKVKKLYKMGYFDGDTYFDIDYNSFVIEANSRLEAIIILKDYFNINVKTSYPFDSFEDETLDDIASDYGVENDGDIFKSKDIDKIMEKYIDCEFENDTLWLEEYNAPTQVLKADF